MGTEAGLPAHELVYRKIRDKLLYGELSPGQAVTINGLVAEIGMSMTPVREALRRLIAEGALEFQGNRRVSVPKMTRARFEDLVFARNALEPHLARLAVSHMTTDGIDALQSIDVAVDRALSTGNVHDYMRGNYQFHMDLYSFAKAPVLLPLVQGLWLQYGPYYRLVNESWAPETTVDMHDETLDALRAKDAAGVGAAVLKDIGQGFDILRRSLDLE